MSTWKHVDAGGKQPPEVQVAVPEHCGDALFVSVSVVPDRVAVNDCPRKVKVAVVAVLEDSVKDELAGLVMPGHDPVTGPEKLTVLPD